MVGCLLAGQAAARNIYVDNVSGDDKNKGLHAKNQGDTSGPLRTIAKALRLTCAGDHIVLADSAMPYRECVSLVGKQHSGVDRRLPFVIEGKGATLDGSVPIPQDGWTFFRDNIFRFRPLSLAYPVLFRDGRRLAPLALPAGTAFPPSLKPLQWCAIEGAVYFAAEDGKLPSDYKLSYAELPTGITLYHVEHVVIRNLTIRGYRVDGVAAAMGTRDAVLENVACTANGQSGASVRGGAGSPSTPANSRGTAPRNC